MNVTSNRGLFLIPAIYAIGLVTCNSDDGGIFGPKEIEVTVDGTVTSQEIKTPVEGVSVEVFLRPGDNAYDSKTTAEGGSYELSFSDDLSKAGMEISL